MANGLPEMPYLVLLRGSQPFRVFPLRKSIITIGRAPINDIVLLDQRVSRYHAQLRYQNGAWWVEDLRSDNGVFLNGKRITKPTIVRDDEIIALGHAVQFEMELAPDPPPGVPQPKIMPGWVLQAGLGVGGILLAGAILVVLLGALAFFAFGLGGSEPWIEIEWSNSDEPVAAGPTAESSEAATSLEFYPTLGPEVVITGPKPGTHIPLGGSFMLQAVAYDEKGVARMDLWIDDQLAISQPSPEAEGLTSFYLNHGIIGTAEGTYALVVRAYNTEGGMGESPAFYVTVSEQIEPKTIAFFNYTVREGDTLERIAAKSGVSLEEIMAANPGLEEIGDPGRVIALPNQGTSAPPEKPAEGENGLKAVESAALEQPVEIPSDLPVDQSASQVLPALYPDLHEAENSPPLPLPAPSNLFAELNGCTVNLSWKDNSSNERGFAILRRSKTEQIYPQLVYVTPANTTSYTDTVLPGSYEYSIEAWGEVTELPPEQAFMPNISKVSDAARSAPLGISILPSPGCIENPAQMRVIYFQPLEFKSFTDATRGAIWYAIQDSTSRRIPHAQGQHYYAGKWFIAPEAFPVPPLLFLNPDQTFFFAAWGEGQIRNGVDDLGVALKSFKPSEIKDNTAATWTASGNGFGLDFKLWSEEIKWTGQGWTTSGQGTNPSIPAPSNLRFSDTAPSPYNKLAWDWSGDSKTIDGFIVYRSYSCKGMETYHEAPTMTNVGVQYFWVKLQNEPAGCGYRYQVSAYGRYGESAVSNALEGETQYTASKVRINFNYLVARLPAGTWTGGQVELKVNHIYRATPAYLFNDDPSPYFFKDLTLDGVKPNNSFDIYLGEREPVTISFSVSKVDGNLNRVGHLCNGTITMRPPIEWGVPSSSTIIKSTNNACYVIIDFSTEPPLMMESGSIIYPHADLKIERAMRIGSQVYVMVDSNGPDPLLGNRIGLHTNWNCYCGDQQVDAETCGSPTIWPHYWVGDSLPQWFYLDEQVDRQMAANPPFKDRTNADGEKCFEKLYVILTYFGGYIDTDLGNNRFMIDFPSIPPMD